MYMIPKSRLNASSGASFFPIPIRTMNQQTYLDLLAPIKAQFTAKPSSFWSTYLNGEVLVLDVHTPEGKSCCVEVTAAWDDMPGELFA